VVVFFFRGCRLITNSGDKFESQFEIMRDDWEKNKRRA
jgi:hypothetical protein